jgi:hypothetical protein
MDKTPKFTAKINEILKGLDPHNRVCSVCSIEFLIDTKDIEFLNKFKVPIPFKCIECRKQIRSAFLNYTTLFKRDCDAPGHTEKIISSIPDGVKFPVYDFDYYWSSDRPHFNNSFDFNLKDPFLNQLEKLFLITPHPALTRDKASINSEYVSYGAQLKNCYYNFGGLKSENVMYSNWSINTKNSVDTLIAANSDLCYEGVYPENCYNCNFVYFSNDCLDCSFIYDCRNCSNCFGCVNLRNKKYCIWNKEYSKDEYFEKIKEFSLGICHNIKLYQEIFSNLIKSLPVRATRNEHSKNIFGNYIIDSNSCLNSTWSFNCENIKNTDFVLNTRDSSDISVAYGVESLYFTSGVGVNCSNVYFSFFGRELQYCEYTINCKNCQYCFLCIGLENSKYCIFNKQYSEEEYFKLLDEIKLRMLEGGEYGEFFPLSMSPFPYNASLSNIMYPVSKEKVLELGGWWYDDKINLPEGIKLIKNSEIEPDIKNTTNDILEVGIISEGNEKPFRIVKDELIFYKNKNIAIPSKTPYERIIDRFKCVNNFKVFNDKCFNCGVEILSSYATSEGYKPYCDDCYKKEIY